MNTLGIEKSLRIPYGNLISSRALGLWAYFKGYLSAGIERGTFRELRLNKLWGMPQILTLLMCVSCTTIHTKTPEGESVTMDEEQFAAYVEQVFRHHNTVVDESLFVMPGGSVATNDPVSLAEMKMHHACQPLNEVVSATATGQSADGWSKMKLADSVPECEAATRILEKLILEDKK